MARAKAATISENSLPSDSNLRQKYALRKPEEVELRLSEQVEWLKKIESDTQEPLTREAAQVARIIAEVLLEQVFS